MVHDLFNLKMQILDEGAEKLLGMNFTEITYTPTEDSLSEDKKNIVLSAQGRKVFQVYQCRPLILSDPHTGNNRKVMLIMFLQKVSISLKETKYQGYFKNDRYIFRGGSTLIIDMANYEIQYIIKKSVYSSDRLFRQLDYAIKNTAHNSEDGALLMQEKEPFASLHIH